ncbi:MAG: arginyltransferase [Thermochromatium sp.]
MSQGPSTGHARLLPLYLTGEHDCSYLTGVRARTLFVDPGARIDGATYQRFIDQGFRRSGTYIYRPACCGCLACVPVRLPVAEFAPNRSQRRNWRLNAPDIRVGDVPAAFYPEHFDLYRRYLTARHADGTMAEDATEDSYRRFLVESWGGTTRFIELRLEGRLVGVAVTDVLEQGLSAVYTFFDPELGRRALGTFGVLTQIQTARRLGRPYLYLGYWIAESRKMVYKERFRPIEAWDGQTWRRFERAQPLNLDKIRCGS